jgi:hypothetical protein
MYIIYVKTKIGFFPLSFRKDRVFPLSFRSETKRCAGIFIFKRLKRNRKMKEKGLLFPEMVKHE